MLIPFIHEGILKTIFIDTWLRISLFGQPAGGFLLTLIDLIILAAVFLAIGIARLPLQAVLLVGVPVSLAVTLMMRRGAKT